MKASEARDIAARWRIPLDSDFHALDSATVERIVAAADERRYRAPTHRNGSRARYFHAYLRRAAGEGSIPSDFAVQPLRSGSRQWREAEARGDLATCGTCGRSWDDGKATAWTPAPSGRCPFEYFH